MSKKSKDVKNRDRSRSRALLLTSVLISFILIISSLVMLGEYSNELRQQADFKGKLYSETTASHLKYAVAGYESGVVNKIVQELNDTSYMSEADFASILRRLSLEDRFSSLMFVRYFKDGKEYSVDSKELDTKFESKAVLELADRDTVCCAGVVTDHRNAISAVAFTAPLRRVPYADSVALFFSVDGVISFSIKNDGEEVTDSRLSVACSEEGEVLIILGQREMGIVEHNNIYEELRSRLNDKTAVDTIQGLVDEGMSGAIPVSIYGDSYVATVSSIREKGANPFAIIALYNNTDIYGSAYMTVNTILGALIIFSAVLAVVSVITFIFQLRRDRNAGNAGDFNNKLKSPTRAAFERTVNEILSRNKATSFAVIMLDIRYYTYIRDHIGDDGIDQLLMYLKLVYSKSIQLDEAYGYIGEGKFLLFIHYRDRESLEARLKSLTSLAGSYKKALPSGYHLTVYGGIYTTSLNIADTAEKMIDLANSAKEDVNNPFDFGTFRLYNEKVHASVLQTEYIEARMADALKNNEFVLFFQPKFDLHKSVTEGCEVLSRWYNKERDEYMQPGVYLPLFEANHFIVNLDKYIYEQVCKYVHDSVRAGERVVPMSVNVSRVTASEPDFLNFFISTKRKYGISDKFITLEFMESFAYEDYNKFKDTVNELHKNGFRCSIDDFGSGFSSYNILKSLQIDEIKLDRLFMRRGLSEDRDNIVLGSIMSVAKQLNIKTIQKGVETMGELENLKALGCDVIQGYVFSKPLYLSDYIDFMEKVKKGGTMSAFGS